MEDIFNQEKYLLDMVKVRLRLYYSKNQFHLICSETNLDFKVKVPDVVLKARKVHISSNAYLGITSALNKNTAKYPVRRLIIKISAESQVCQERWIMCFAMLSLRELR